MILTKTLVLNARQNLEEQIRILDLNLSKVFAAFRTRVRFGTVSDGQPGENLEGEWQVFTSHATPDTEFTVAHTLGAIPEGRIIVFQDKAGHLYQNKTTGTNWTSTDVYFKCDVASVEFGVFLLR